MDWLYLVILIVLSAGGFYAGIQFVGRAESWWWVLVWCLSLAVIILYAVFRFYPAVEYHLLPEPIGRFTNIISFIPFATLFMGIAARKSRTRTLAVEVAFIAIIVFVYGLLRVNWIYSGTGVEPSRFTLTYDGICLQSTPYSCGAASAVTFLRQFGVETTEAEMAKLTCTRTALGVEIVNLARGVAGKAGANGLAADIITADYRDLIRLGGPCIVNISYSPLVDHVIVVMKAEEGGVEIADPLIGRREWSREDFLSRWRGSAIIIKKINQDR